MACFDFARTDVFTAEEYDVLAPAGDCHGVLFDDHAGIIATFARAFPPRSSNLARRRCGFGCTTFSGCPGYFREPAQFWAAMSKMIPDRPVR